MIQIAADLARLYTSFMEQKGLETDQHRYVRISSPQRRRNFSIFCPIERQPLNKKNLSKYPMTHLVLSITLLFSKMGARSYLSWGFIHKCRQDKGFDGMRSFGHELIIREV
jgi:hypothetical protein